MYKHNFKIAFRNILKNKFRYSITVLSMAVGLFVFVFVGYFVKELSQGNESLPNYERMAELKLPSKSTGSYELPGHLALAKIKEANIQGVEKWAFSSYGTLTATMSFELQPDSFVFKKGKVGYVNKEYFEVYSAHFIDGGLGNWNNYLAVITDRFARKVFGEQNPVGRRIVDQTGKSYVIVGVMEAFSQSVDKTDLYVPLTEERIINSGDRCQMAALLVPGVSMKTINKQLNRLTDIKYDKEGVQYYYNLEELPKMEPQGLVALSFILLVGSLVFLAAFINFINLLVGSLLGRIREMTLRKTAGATQLSVFLLVMTETCIVLGASFLLALGISEITVSWFNEQPWSTDIYIDTIKFLSTMAVYMAGVLLVTYLMVAFLVCRVGKQIVAQGIQGALVRNGKHRMRNVLLGVQLVICFFFVGATLSVAMQFNRMKNDQNIYNLISYEECNRIFYVSPQNVNNRAELIEAVKKMPVVENTLNAEYIKPYGSSEYHTTDGTTQQYFRLQVDSGYFAFFRMSKPSLEKWMGDGQAVFVNKQLAKQLVKNSSLSSFEIVQQYYHWDKFSSIDRHSPQRVVGVLDKVPFTSPDLPVALSYSAYGYSSFYVRFYEGQVEKGLKQLEKVLYQYQPKSLPLNIKSLNEVVNPNCMSLKVISAVFGIFSLLAIIIAMFGIYSAITLDTQHRQKEVAIRKVNGATVRDILHLFGKLYLRMVFIAALISVAVLVLFMNKTTNRDGGAPDYLNPLYWILLLLIVGGFVLITVLYRLRKIAQVNPAETIKKE